MTGLQPAGFPHSDIKGSMPACGSPLLFAACHVLLRRLVPLASTLCSCSLDYKYFETDFPVSVAPETNCFISSGQLTFYICNWSSKTFSCLFSVQLSRCVADLSAQDSLQNPENDTDCEDDNLFCRAVPCSLSRSSRFQYDFRRNRPG